jgi:mannose-6-phosphate isomerase-like protein (cupin superfamily)
MPARAPSTHVRVDSGSVGRTVWGEPSATTVTADQTGGAFMLIALTLSPDWRRRRYVHHRFDECFVVISGSVRFDIEDRQGAVLAGPGDTVYVPRGLARSAETAGVGPAAVLLLQTPAPDECAASALSDAGWLEGVELLDAR